jgi:putative transposase
MRFLDEQSTRPPLYGVWRMTAWLQQQGYEVKATRVRRVLRLMGLEAISPQPHVSRAAAEARVYPSGLKEVVMASADQVWSADIPDIRRRQGFVSWVAIMEWYSRDVLAWEVSVTLDGSLCRAALERALRVTQPTLVTTDQGGQFTSQAFPGRLLANGIHSSLDGRGRAFDNIFVERLWRSVKDEEVSWKD